MQCRVQQGRVIKHSTHSSAPDMASYCATLQHAYARHMHKLFLGLVGIKKRSTRKKKQASLQLVGEVQAVALGNYTLQVQVPGSAVAYEDSM